MQSLSLPLCSCSPAFTFSSILSPILYTLFHSHFYCHSSLYLSPFLLFAQSCSPLSLSFTSSLLSITLSQSISQLFLISLFLFRSHALSFIYTTIYIYTNISWPCQQLLSLWYAVVVFNLAKAGNISKAILGESVGTLIGGGTHRPTNVV